MWVIKCILKNVRYEMTYETFKSQNINHERWHSRTNSQIPKMKSKLIIIAACTTIEMRRNSVKSLLFWEILQAARACRETIKDRDIQSLSQWDPLCLFLLRRAWLQSLVFVCVRERVCVSVVLTYIEYLYRVYLFYINVILWTHASAGVKFGVHPVTSTIRTNGQSENKKPACQA